jgi:microcystin-dependent protein
MRHYIIDWLVWIYGKWFVGHTWLGFFVVFLIGAVIMASVLGILWLKAVDEYAVKQQQEGTAAFPKPEAVAERSPSTPTVTANSPVSPNTVTETSGAQDHVAIDVHRALKDKATATVTHSKKTPVNAPISQGPGSTLSINQSGGITASTVIIGPLPPRLVVLTPAQAKSVTQAMSPFSTVRFKMWIVNPTGNNEQFADALDSALENAGLVLMERNTTGMMVWNGGGQTPEGLSCIHTQDTDEAVNLLGKALLAAGSIDRPISCKIREGSSGWFSLYVTAK